MRLDLASRMVFLLCMPVKGSHNITCKHRVGCGSVVDEIPVSMNSEFFLNKDYSQELLPLHKMAMFDVKLSFEVSSTTAARHLQETKLP